jgi:predicted membrane-bound spermidine synthase
VSPRLDPVAINSESRALISFVFAGSGAAGLMFEIAWMHRTALVFGSSIWATSLILSSFMAGLAVGNLLVTRFGHRVSGFLRTYALLELVVAIGGIGATYVPIALTGDLAVISRRIVDAPWMINTIRFVVAFAVVLVPSSAMGATLPVLVAGTVFHTTEFSVALGRLYGWNTLGAVGGVLAAETVCIRFFGVTGTAWAAALLNVAAATATLAAVRRSKPIHRVQEPVVPVTSSGPRSACLSRRFFAARF